MRGGTTINDVAARAGVSIKTVSRVMNREPNVREDTRLRVLQAAEALRYAPNPAARGLAGGRSQLLGLVYDNPSDSYLARVQHGVLEALEERGFGLVLLPCDSRAGDLVARLGAIATRSRLEGLVLTPPLADHTALLQQLARQGLPHVRIAPRDTRRGLVVMMDDRGAARELVAFMVSLGHRRVAIIRGHPVHGASEWRYRGYRDALGAAGIAVEQRLVCEGGFDFASGRRAAARLLDLEPAPTAIFACNDDMAAGVLHEAHARSMRIPLDLSVAGFDDTPIASQIWPALSTVHQPITDMGREAIHLLVDALDGGAHEARRQLDYELVLRDSIGPPPASSPRAPARRVAG